MDMETTPLLIILTLAAMAWMVWLLILAREFVRNQKDHLETMRAWGRCVHCDEPVDYGHDADGDRTGWFHTESGRILCASEVNAPHSVASPIISGIRDADGHL